MSQNTLTAGATERSSANRIFVNLRCGDIAQTSNKQLPGFKPDFTEKASGERTDFYSKRYNQLTGYITNIKWFDRAFKNSAGSERGWDVTIDAGSETYVLKVNEMDSPYNRFMNTMLNVDFTKLVQLVGMKVDETDKAGKKTGRKKKLLLVWQESLGFKAEVDANGDPKKNWMQGMFPERWLTKLVADKLKEGIALTDEERNRVQFDVDGNPDRNYPYIRQKGDGKWSFEVWQDFLRDQILDIVQPRIIAANEIRPAATVAPDGPDEYEPEAPTHTGEPLPATPQQAQRSANAVTAPSNPNDDIPF